MGERDQFRVEKVLPTPRNQEGEAASQKDREAHPTWISGALPSLSVSAGTLLRIRFPQIISCLFLEENWEPIGGDCYFPFDLFFEGKVKAGVLVSTPASSSQRIFSFEVSVSAADYGVQKITVPSQFVRLSPRDFERVQKENDRIRSLWSLRSPRRYHFPLAPPLQPLPPGKNFGVRRIVNEEERLPHTGVDFSAEEGTPVYACEEGTVVLAGDFFFSGNSVFLDHGDGLISMYFHLRTLTVKEGDRVRRGDKIGEVGKTGRTTGPHLHFAIRYRGQRVDPMLFIQEIPPLVLSTGSED